MTELSLLKLSLAPKSKHSTVAGIVIEKVPVKVTMTTTDYGDD